MRIHHLHSSSSDEINFASFLVYCPQRKCSTPVCKNTQKWIQGVKNNRIDNNGVHVIKRIADEMAKRKDAELVKFFEGEVSLVPVPKSAPLAPGAFWPAHKICEQLLSVGFGNEILSNLVRKYPTKKSAYTQAGVPRLEPDEHCKSFEWNGGLIAPKKIILIDDVVTRGSTFLGAAQLIRKHFPNIEISGFAISRTIKKFNITSIIDPCVGKIILFNGSLNRHP
jgi:hypothetical protein